MQVSKNIPLGSFLQPLSVYNGSQYDIDLTLYQVISTFYDHFSSSHLDVHLLESENRIVSREIGGLHIIM